MDHNQIKRKRLLICGDSYMALSYSVINKVHAKNLDEINDMHWSRHLDPNFNVVNLAQPGASNLMILSQLRQGLIMAKPAAVVLGFTSFGRLEFNASEAFKKDHPGSKYFTSCNPERMSTAQRLFHAGFLDEYPIELNHLNESALIEYTVLLSQSQVPTVYSLGLAKLSRGQVWQQPMIMDLRSAQLPINLIDFDQWGPDDMDAGCFHVKNPGDHLKFADQINKWLLTI